MRAHLRPRCIDQSDTDGSSLAVTIRITSGMYSTCMRRYCQFRARLFWIALTSDTGVHATGHHPLHALLQPMHRCCPRPLDAATVIHAQQNAHMRDVLCVQVLPAKEACAIQQTEAVYAQLHRH